MASGATLNILPFWMRDLRILQNAWAQLNFSGPWENIIAVPVLQLS